MENPAEKLKRLVTFLGVTGAVYGAFRFLLPLVVPFFAAWGLAVLLWPSAAWIAAHTRVHLRSRPVFLCRKRSAGVKERLIGIPVGMVGAAECLLALGVLGAGCYFLGRKLCAELLALRAQLPDWVDAADRVLTGWCHEAERCFSLKNDCLVLLAREMLRSLLRTAKKSAMPYVMANSVTVLRGCTRILLFLAVTLMVAGLLLQELPQWRRLLHTSLFCRELNLICEDFLLAANAYLRTQGILLLLISALCTLVFRMMGNPYYLLAGIGTGILDALPVFGTGTVLVPWSLLLFFRGKPWGGFLLFVLCAACYLLRQILETRLMSRKLGLSAFTEFMALIVGLELFGLPGLFLGPVGFLLIHDLSALISGDGPRREKSQV